MFTGIIETLGILSATRQEGTNLHLTIRSSISDQLKIDQSVAHNGVCLTVVALGEGWHEVTAVQETLGRTTLGTLVLGDILNLERCLLASSRFDGHIVQGHVDLTARCTSIKDQDGSWTYAFDYPNAQGLTVEKGSICIDGVSLTVVDSMRNSFTVVIIPYTYSHTRFHQLRPGSSVNLEFDIIGKYVAKLLAEQINSRSVN